LEKRKYQDRISNECCSFDWNFDSAL